MKCGKDCSVPKDATEHDASIRNSTCHILNEVLNTSDVTVKALYEMIEMNKAHTDRINEAENTIIQLLKEKEQLKRELERVNNNYMKLRSDYAKLTQSINSIDELLSSRQSNVVIVH